MFTNAPAYLPAPLPHRYTDATIANTERTQKPKAKIAFIGGTGPEGLGLAMRFAKAGHAVFIGSRSEERAAEAYAKIQEKVPEAELYGGLNAEGAEKADIVFLTVPSDAHHDTLIDLADAIGDKILVDVVVPMLWNEEGPKAISVEAGSAALEAQELLPNAKIVSGFHHLDGSQLQKIDKPMQGDVIVCSDHKTAKNKVMELVEDIEYVRALDGGGLVNSSHLEDWTVVLLHINKIYKSHAGIRITGI